MVHFPECDWAFEQICTLVCFSLEKWVKERLCGRARVCAEQEKKGNELERGTINCITVDSARPETNTTARHECLRGEARDKEEDRVTVMSSGQHKHKYTLHWPHNTRFLPRAQCGLWGRAESMPRTPNTTAGFNNSHARFCLPYLFDWSRICFQLSLSSGLCVPFHLLCPTARHFLGIKCPAHQADSLV